MEPSSLAERIDHREFAPEVYAYPTPRMLSATNDFSIEQAHFTDNINIYVHIPFCSQLCSFCGYLKTTDRGGMLREQYVDAIIGEIQRYTPIIREKNVATLHFGGGTPTLLADHQLERILQALTTANPQLFCSSTEVSIESTPELVDKDRFERLRHLGFNRASIGVQTLNNCEIALSGRKNDMDTSSRAISSLQEAGIENVVVDLMIGIAGQTVASFERSARSLAVMRPDTVEFYALGLMPGTKLSRAGGSLMNNDDIYRCYDIGQKIFLSSGYAQNCHNRYAIPGRGGFLQEDYLFDGMSVIGLGAGARSYAKNVQYRNIHSLDGRAATKEYIAAISSGKTAVATAFYINNDERARQYVIGHIECLDRTAFAREFGPFECLFPSELKQLYDSGVMQIDDATISLTAHGLKYRDLVARMFFSEASSANEHAYRMRSAR